MDFPGLGFPSHDRRVTVDFQATYSVGIAGLALWMTSTDVETMHAAAIAGAAEKMRTDAVASASVSEKVKTLAAAMAAHSDARAKAKHELDSLLIQFSDVALAGEVPPPAAVERRRALEGEIEARSEAITKVQGPLAGAQAEVRRTNEATARAARSRAMRELIEQQAALEAKILAAALPLVVELLSVRESARIVQQATEFAEARAFDAAFDPAGRA